VKGTGVRAKSNPADEPDFRLYPALDDTAKGAVIAGMVAVTSQESATITPTNEEQHLYQPMALPENFGVLDPLATRSGLQHDDIWNKSLPYLDLPSVKDGVRNLSSSEDPPKRVMPTKQDTFDEEMEETYALKNWVPEDSAAVTDVSFDRLIDEMFRHDQTVDFSELLKLASV
jgi:hypothetical protein